MKKFLIRSWTASFWVILGVATVLWGQGTPYNDQPEWISTPYGYYSTGLGIADINQDGWDDIVVANGNDMARQPLVVYYNNGDGSFPVVPSWTSASIDYHGHLAVGDIDGDGYPDVAVSVFLGPAGFTEPGHVEVYFNLGGQLESTPSYQTADSVFTFSLALGDADGDGDLDLAVAGGQPYSIGMGPYSTEGRVYYNQNGNLQILPGWQSQVAMGALDVDFADFDRNGYLDVVFACHLTPNYIFLADSTGQLHTQPDWQSQDNSYFANSLTVATVDDNPYPDLMISDNSQLGGLGKFKAYFFAAMPSGQTMPGWYSTSGGFGSAVLAEDVTGDGAVDLLTGRWWGAVQLYRGDSGSFGTSPYWSSSTNSVVEAYALRDLDQDGRVIKQDTLNITADSQHVIYLSQKAVERILSVKVNGQLLSPGTDYCMVPGGQWISTRLALQAGDQVVIEYLYSLDRDLVVSNWDSGIGNYLFYNHTDPNGISLQNNIPQNIKLTPYPNPFNRSCTFLFNLPSALRIELSIYDVSGRLVKTLFRGRALNGRQQIIWNGTDETGAEVSSGVYFYRFYSPEYRFGGKLILLK